MVRADGTFVISQLIFRGLKPAATILAEAMPLFGHQLMLTRLSKRTGLDTEQFKRPA